MTAIWTGSDHERSEAFWGEDDVYYVRRRLDGGSDEWFCFTELDEELVASKAASGSVTGGSSLDGLGSAGARLVLGGRATRRARSGDGRIDALAGEALPATAFGRGAASGAATFAWVARRRRRS